mmetsp:Transcript_17440/g.27867  ORF Transcript_17440/g.27867 Transcript_17440/m.27867 type:complete len:328 (+) Transcript_17440:248-1231(+)
MQLSERAADFDGFLHGEVVLEVLFNLLLEPQELIALRGAPELHRLIDVLDDQSVLVDERQHRHQDGVGELGHVDLLHLLRHRQHVHRRVKVLGRFLLLRPLVKQRGAVPRCCCCFGLGRRQASGRVDGRRWGQQRARFNLHVVVARRRGRALPIYWIPRLRLGEPDSLPPPSLVLLLLHLRDLHGRGRRLAGGEGGALEHLAEEVAATREDVLVRGDGTAVLPAARDDAAVREDGVLQQVPHVLPEVRLLNVALLLRVFVEDINRAESDPFLGRGVRQRHYHRAQVPLDYKLLHARRELLRRVHQLHDFHRFLGQLGAGRFRWDDAQ